MTADQYLKRICEGPLLLKLYEGRRASERHEQMQSQEPDVRGARRLILFSSDFWRFDSGSEEPQKKALQDLEAEPLDEKLLAV